MGSKLLYVARASEIASSTGRYTRDKVVTAVVGLFVLLRKRSRLYFDDLLRRQGEVVHEPYLSTFNGATAGPAGGHPTR